MQKQNLFDYRYEIYFSLVHIIPSMAFNDYLNFIQEQMLMLIIIMIDYLSSFLDFFVKKFINLLNCFLYLKLANSMRLNAVLNAS